MITHSLSLRGLRIAAVDGSEFVAYLMQRSSDGAVYVKGWVTDTALDGECAHAETLWWHKNGAGYYDRAYVCGAGTTKYIRTSARNWTLYKQVSVNTYANYWSGYDASVLVDFSTWPQ